MSCFSEAGHWDVGSKSPLPLGPRPAGAQKHIPAAYVGGAKIRIVDYDRAWQKTNHFLLRLFTTFSRVSVSPTKFISTQNLQM